MSSGIATLVKGDKWKAVEIGSSPEGQPMKSRSRSNMKTAAKESSNSPPTMGPPWPPAAWHKRWIESLENQLSLAQRAFQLLVESIQEQLDEYRVEQEAKMGTVKKKPSSGSRGRSSSSKGKGK